MIKYIFSINTGRSGSHYLSNVLEEFENIIALHEPYPVMNGQPMVEFLKGNSAKMEAKMKEKMEAINSVLIENKHYIETNHTFIKGFGWLIPSLIPHNQLGVIFLKRSKDEIIKSLYRVNCTPLNNDGLNWLMNPLMKNPINSIPYYDKIKYRLLFYIFKKINRYYKPLTNSIKKLKIINEYELKILDWYVEETYSQGEKFKKKYPNIKIFETTTNKLNNVEEFEKMFHFFGLDFKPKDSFYKKIKIKTNLRPDMMPESCI